MTEDVVNQPPLSEHTARVRHLPPFVCPTLHPATIAEYLSALQNQLGISSRLGYVLCMADCLSFNDDPRAQRHDDGSQHL